MLTHSVGDGGVGSPPGVEIRTNSGAGARRSHRVHLNRDTRIRYQQRRDTLRGSREGGIFDVGGCSGGGGGVGGAWESRGALCADPRDPKSIDDACNHLVTAALC